MYSIEHHQIVNDAVLYYNMACRITSVWCVVPYCVRGAYNHMIQRLAKAPPGSPGGAWRSLIINVLLLLVWCSLCYTRLEYMWCIICTVWCTTHHDMLYADHTICAVFFCRLWCVAVTRYKCWTRCGTVLYRTVQHGVWYCTVQYDEAWYGQSITWRC